jgi:hypothetical protein
MDALGELFSWLAPDLLSELLVLLGGIAVAGLFKKKL